MNNKKDERFPPGYRTRELWAYLSLDPRTNVEGIMGGGTSRDVVLPFVFAHRATADSMLPVVLAGARLAKAKVRLARFELKESQEIYFD